ncbi:HAMP domain-containing sensor histidine kinase [Allocoprococcus similis]|uniref:HAMP domain-containing sensor histidine kinase n=1 Tax=Coprococcus comes TaxID=410072 RepID=UPI00156FD288|nr:HAMP domain-containing sensor histidine kinase [Coprococcus comes]NSG31733.1 HAMP domain-containing protein [Coprococcus comes]
MKHSIKRQMLTVFVGLILFMIVVFMIVNGSFLEKYYISNKKSEFIKVYTMVQEGVENGTISSETPEKDLGRLTEKNNISIAVIDSEYNVVYTNVREKQMMVVQLFGYLYDKNHQEVLEKTDSYDICKSVDPQNNTEYLTMWGNFDNGDIFIMRSPLESIRSAVTIFNRFIGVVGGCVILVSVLLAWYFSKRITEPIKELATLSQKMADLDFDAKYTSGGSNEIGVLGENFNRMSERLEQTISNLKEANYKLQKDIEQKEKRENMRSEFLGNVSHELKTPIALIQGYAEGLKEGVNDDPESREFYCEVIMDEAGKMNRMVKNLLALNQLEFGEDDVQFERFDITSLISGVLQSLDILIEQKEAQVIFRHKNPIYVWADEFKVEQVVRNYVNNALNHVDGEKVIEIKITQENDVAKITVFNTGTPIPEEDLPHIWEKFYKVDKARTREYGGNGIGLSIVKAIMDSFGKGYGAINHTNGVEFWFELDMK